MKKQLKLLFLTFLSFFAISSLWAQPDLTLLSMSASPTTVKKGEVMTVTYNVKNIGTSSSQNCVIGFYISRTPSFDDAILLSRVSLETLSAGVSTGNIKFVYPIPHHVTTGTNYVIISIDDLEEVNESDETNNAFYASNLLSVSGIKYSQNLPYPIIFVHGLVGAYTTWDSLISTLQRYYGWSYGGNMNFCLNQDGNTATSNVSNDYKDWTNMQSLSSADLYTVNFNTSRSGDPLSDGNNDLQSNQSGIVKQGYAIHDAVKHILDVTGRDKVILVGHSMGGLASREYLQNSNLWQNDGQHHIAKLFTIGTPHGGSNATFFGLGGILGIADELSEAVRDLRISYYSGHEGVYLFGGTENTSDITGFISNFCNVDVNCNGVIGNNIIGLNQKTLPNNIPYTCVIGIGSYLGGDGVVSELSANLNNYYGAPFIADTFVLKQRIPCIGCTWHQELNKQIGGAVKGMDEANDYQYAYNIELDKLYFGLISQQSLGGQYSLDYDDYKFTKKNGKLSIEVFNIPLSQFKITILNSSLNSVYMAQSNGKNYLKNDVYLPAGSYYLELYGTPTDHSWFYPYAFKITNTEPQGIDEITEQNLFNCYNYPNPFNQHTTISFTLPEPNIVTIKLYNTIGQFIQTLTDEAMSEGKHEILFDGSKLPSGVYFYTIQAGKHSETHKLTICSPH